MSKNANSYRFQLGYWVLVLIVSLMAWQSITEFGRSARLVKTEWLNHLTNVCQANKMVCKSVDFVNSDAWWTSQKMVEVTPQKATSAQGVEAYRLIDAALTSEQRKFLKVYLRQDAAGTTSTGDHS
jgi:N6-adenosine-specific RNA methylase IME4